MAGRINPGKSQAGRAGGLARYKCLGKEGMRILGRKGGRPRLKTIEELLASENKKEEVPNSLLKSNRGQFIIKS